MTIEGHSVGDDLSVSTLTQAAGLATCTNGSAHGYETGDWVFIDGAVQTEYNGIVQITVTSTTAFTFSVDSGATSPATGTITSTNQKKTFVTQSVTLNGQTRVALSTPIARSTLATVPNQDRAANLVGEIYVYEDTALSGGKPTDTTKIHLTVEAGKNQSEKASTSTS